MLRNTELKMRRIFLSAVICLVGALPSPAQDFSRLKGITASAGGGFTFPLGALSNHSKPGFSFVASAGPRFERFTFTLDFALDYASVKNSFRDPQFGVDLANGSVVRIWSLTLNPGYQFIKQEKFGSYVSGGYGAYNRRLLLESPGPTPVEICDEYWGVCVSNASGMASRGDGMITKGGFNAGGGVTFGAGKKFFIDVHYHHMFMADSPTELIPVTFGIRW
jgi:opacity protein-like surface antigen